jgi:hypothetical protein
MQSAIMQNVCRNGEAVVFMFLPQLEAMKQRSATLLKGTMGQTP